MEPALPAEIIRIPPLDREAERARCVAFGDYVGFLLNQLQNPRIRQDASRSIIGIIHEAQAKNANLERLKEYCDSDEEFDSAEEIER